MDVLAVVGEFNITGKNLSSTFKIFFSQKPETNFLKKCVIFYSIFIAGLLFLQNILLK